MFAAGHGGCSDRAGRRGDAVLGRGLQSLSKEKGQAFGPAFSDSRRDDALRVHRLEELGIALGVAQLVEQELDRIATGDEDMDRP
jgi:hypothetical protein